MSMNQFTLEELLLNIRQAIPHHTNCSYMSSSAKIEKKLSYQQVETLLAKDNKSNTNANSYHIPIVRVKVVSPVPDGFNWRDYYIHTLLILSDDVHNKSLGE